LIGRISAASLEDAIRTELEGLARTLIQQNVERARESFATFEAHAGCVSERKAELRTAVPPPEWIELAPDPSFLAAPDIRGSATSELVPTGLWRTLRPVIDLELCNRCSWICSTLCPDGAIDVGSAREPSIDYDHCKGCMLCVAVCPPHAIRALPESEASNLGGES
jgi:pyruvate ferredoxin oxidoreductase gamma subunit